jgi:hypothetical protein
VLDNSGSMGDELDAVAEAVDQLTTQLGNAALDFRIAMLTTEYSQRSAGPTFAGNGQGCASSRATSPSSRRASRPPRASADRVPRARTGRSRTS